MRHLGTYREQFDHDAVIREVREMGRELGVDEEEAVAEIEAWLATRRR